MVTHHPKDGHPPFKIYQKDLYYRLEIWHLDLTHKIETMLSAIDGQPPSPGWSPTIPRKVTHNPKSTWRNCTTELKFANKTKLIKSRSCEVPWMVIHYSKGAYPPAKIDQNKLCYPLKIWLLDLTQKIKTRWTSLDAYSLCPGWSPTISRMVTHRSKSTKRKCATDLKFHTET